MTEREALLVLNGLPGMGPVTLHRLLDRFAEPAAILAAPAAELQRVRGVGPTTASSIVRWREQLDPAREVERVRRAGVRFVTYREPEYPRPLLQIPDPPIGLYLCGELPVDLTAVAVVGSRRTTAFGRSLARRMAEELAEAGLWVVSGMALGIDTEAHRGALERVGGRTMAVLGTGIDVVYPRENEDLYEEIGARGVLASEFPMGRRGDVQSFPVRNRVVAGLSRMVVVVESDVKGGAMITARFAADYGRTVGAVPGRVDQPTSAGCLQLIREGATLIRSADDILEEMAFCRRAAPVAEAGSARGRADRPEGLTDHEGRVWEALREGDMLGADELAERTGVGMGEVAAALLGLELRRLVARRLDGRYELEVR